MELTPEEKVNQSFLNQLVEELGFPIEKSIEALRVTKNVSVDAALEYLLISDPSRIEKQGLDEELTKLLEELQLSKYIPVFKKEEVDLETLLALSDPDKLLERLGIPLGPRAKIVGQLKKMAPKKRRSIFSFLKKSTPTSSSPPPASGMKKSQERATKTSVKEGFLEKKKRTGGWKKEYYVIKDACLLVFSSESDASKGTNPKLSYKLEDCTFQVHSAVPNCLEVNKTSPESPSTLILRASSEIEQNEWLEALMNAKFPSGEKKPTAVPPLISKNSVMSTSMLMGSQSPPNSTTTTGSEVRRNNLYGATPSSTQGGISSQPTQEFVPPSLNHNNSIYGATPNNTNAPPPSYEPPKEYHSVLGWSGLLSRKDSHNQLKDCPQGTFLVRWSTNANSYVLSFKKGRDVLHIGSIKPTGKGTEIIVTIQNESTALYPSLLEYCESMKKNGFITMSITAQTGINNTQEQKKEYPAETIYESLISAEEEEGGLG